MLKLKLEAEPFWITLFAGVRVQVLPARSSIMFEVRREIFGSVTSEDDEPTSVPMLDYHKAVARRVIIAWEGICDGDEKPIKEPTPEWIDALMEDDAAYQAFVAAYLSPAEQIDSEKNG